MRPRRREVAASLGAGLVLYGDLGTIGPDSVHLRAALYDAGMQGMRRDFDVRGEASRLDALADSLAIRVLRELSTSGTLAGGKLSTMGTSSLTALKAFVEGQRLYRVGRVDSARACVHRGRRSRHHLLPRLAWRGRDLHSHGARERSGGPAGARAGNPLQVRAFAT